MKNFFMNDYAINKNRKGIVYGFADCEVEITLEKYLEENPDGSEAEFLKFKAISDGIYRDQDREENAEGYKNLSLQGLADVSDPTTPSPDVLMEAEEVVRERETVLRAVELFYESGKMTVIQHRRFYLSFYGNLSTRKIAAMEGVEHRAVWESLRGCEKKLKKFLKNTSPPPLIFCDR